MRHELPRHRRSSLYRSPPPASELTVDGLSIYLRCGFVRYLPYWETPIGGFRLTLIFLKNWHILHNRLLFEVQPQMAAKLESITLSCLFFLHVTQYVVDRRNVLTMTYRLIDLFCGAGGMTLGFVDPKFSGHFESVFAVDNDPAAFLTYTHNFHPGRLFHEPESATDLSQYLSEGGKIPEADVVIGGPPCQGFSLLNKKREGDQRRALWQPFMDVVQKSHASVFVIENVRQLHNSPERVAIERRAAELGFNTACKVLNSANYGTPQIRYRTVFIGWKRELYSPEFPPKETHRDPNSTTKENLPEWITVKDAIGDLPDPVGTEIRSIEPPLDLHFGRSPTELSKRRYRLVPLGGNRFDLQSAAPELTPQCWIKKTSGGTDLFGRLWWDRPSVTIRTEFFKPEKGRYLHPEEHRPITHREAARLMGFPDEFKFKGSKTEIARQIGNAVPPPLAAAAAGVVVEILRGRIQQRKVA